MTGRSGAPLSGRSRLFETARAALRDRYQSLAGLHFVETGTTRGDTDDSMAGDGWGTRWWGWLAADHGATLQTIDIDPHAIARSRAVTSEYARVITYTCADSVAALRASNAPIHLLYLDSFDSGPGSPQHHLAEAEAALPRLTPQSVIVLDDTSPVGTSRREWSGKGELAIPFFEQHGFILVAAVNGGAVMARGPASSKGDARLDEAAPGARPEATENVALHIDEYRTGWDRAVRREPEAFEIDAHAPSTIVLTALGDGAIVIVGGMRKGGNTRGQLFIDGQPADYGVARTVRVVAGRRVSLAVELDDDRKDQCWNYWRITGATMSQHVSEIPQVAVLPFPAEIALKRHARLGDGIGVLTAIECYCEANGIASVVVDGGPAFVDIAKVFEFRHVVTKEAGPDAFNADDLFAQASWHEPWAKRIVRRLRAHFGGEDAEVARPRVRISASEITKEDVVLGQFDTRSAAPLAPREIGAVIQGVSGGRPFALIGGPDTRPYFPGVEYRLGDLEFIVRQLLACRCFVGVDSGIAHLAGTLGVPAYVVNAIDLDVVQKMFGDYPNMTILNRADYSGLPKVASRTAAEVAPRSEIWVAGMPSRGGGADTELDHQIDLWRMFGVDVHIVPMNEHGAYMPSPNSEAMRSCYARGCRVHRYEPGIFAGKVVVSFCNGPFLKALPAIIEAGRPDCVVWVNCMTWVFEDERRAHAHGWIDLFCYQSRFQRDIIVPQLEAIAPVHELPYRAFYNVSNALQAVRFAYRPPSEYFGIGRISRNDPAKFSPDTWRIYDDVVAPLPKRAMILGFDSRIEERIGPPAAGLQAVTYPVGGYPVEQLLSEMHVMIHKTGGSRENWPRTLLEAYNAGVVPIFENDYGCKEMIIDGVTGFLCDSSAEMSERASQLAHDEPLRQQMAEAGYRHLTEVLAAPALCWEGWKALLETADTKMSATITQNASAELNSASGFVIDGITATRSNCESDRQGRQRIDFSVWLNVDGLPAPVTARIQVVEVHADRVRPLAAPVELGSVLGQGSHHHSGEIVDIEPSRHHRLTVRVHDGARREYIGHLDIVRDDVEEMASGFAAR